MFTLLRAIAGRLGIFLKVRDEDFAIGARCLPTGVLVLLCGIGFACLDTAIAEEAATPSAVAIRWSVRIPLRDQVGLNATVYLPKDQRTPAPCIFTLTPYTGDSYHDRAMYFAGHGLPFLLVDVRGRGNSEGTFTPVTLLHDPNHPSTLYVPLGQRRP